MLARRLISPRLATGLRAYSTAPLKPPYGTASPETYAEARAAAEAYVAKEGWDMDSLVEQPVVWGLQDTFQHLNNVHAFRFFETGRMQFVRSLLPELPAGSEPSLLQGKPGGVGVILASIGARYKRPVNAPDTLLVAHRVTAVSKDRFSLDHICYSFQQRAVVTTGSSEMVTYDYGALRKMDMTPEFRKALEKRMPTSA
ncbi:HotDog domain-containing protein [Leucosporidium creatinivorum]|uniref:HotDog domain-containing protein n=1 Tax=Leucosporidium creatinivorum TaxID=106004 RepID=A0A1Y2CRS9_9BASI|nr:HotDog domain-containing protein [Leucosporidium creatinivorum]